MYHGIYIDIFLFDNIEPNSTRGKYQIWLLRIIDSLFKYRIKTRYEKLEPGRARNKAKFKHKLIKILPFSKMQVENWVLRIMTRFNDINTEYLADLANLGIGVLENFMMTRSNLEDSIEWEFEGYKFPVSRYYDEVLTRAYGDYMQLSDEENRVSHHDIIEIDC